MTDDQKTTLFFRGGDLFRIMKDVRNPFSPNRPASLNQASQKSRVSYPTVLRYTSDNPLEHINSFDTIKRFLTDGLGLTDQELGAMKFTDIFAIVDLQTGEFVAADSDNEIMDRIIGASDHETD